MDIPWSRDEDQGLDEIETELVELVADHEVKMTGRDAARLIGGQELLEGLEGSLAPFGSVEGSMRSVRLPRSEQTASQLRGSKRRLEMSVLV